MITFKLEVMMDRDAHSWACKNPHFGETVESILQNGYSNEYYNTSIYSEFDSLESASVAEYLLTNLVTEYEILYKQSLVKEMTIADIERIVGHPVKIIK